MKEKAGFHSEIVIYNENIQLYTLIKHNSQKNVMCPSSTL